MDRSATETTTTMTKRSGDALRQVIRSRLRFTSKDPEQKIELIAELSSNGRHSRVILNGVDVSGHIRGIEIRSFVDELTEVRLTLGAVATVQQIAAELPEIYVETTEPSSAEHIRKSPQRMGVDESTFGNGSYSLCSARIRTSASEEVSCLAKIPTDQNLCSVHRAAFSPTRPRRWWFWR